MTLAWSVSGATGLSIDHGVGAVAPVTVGTLSVNVTASATWTLTASDGSGVSAASASVTLVSPAAPPAITSFSATPSSVPSGGGSVLLAWTVSGATGLTIDNGVGAVASLTAGNVLVNVTSPVTFTLTASNGNGASTASVAVTQRPPDGGPSVAENLACEQQLGMQWLSAPPAVGMGSQNSEAAYESVLGGLMASYGVPGGAIAVTHNGQLVFTRAIGFADVLASQPAHPGHLFRIASLTKQLTATAILQLVEKGTLSLDAPAFSYLPNLLPLPGTTVNPQLASITIRNLLNHTGGWNRDSEAVGDPMFDSIAIAAALGEPGPASADDTIRYMLDKPLTYTPGTTYCYSNFGYAVLGAIIEQVTGSAYQSYLQQNVLAPQAISDTVIGGSLESDTLPEEVTYYDYPGAPLATSVFPNVPSPVPWPYGGFNMQALKAHGGWVASAVDMLRFASGVDTYVGPPTLISPSSLSEMLANPGVAQCNPDGSTSPTSTASWYGFGFEVNQYGNYWHTGSLPGTATEDVIANNTFNFAAFFNTRPENANQFATDLDNDLWTAFNAVQSWSNENYFDQYASFTGWLMPAAYAAQAAIATRAGEYSARAEGRLNDGGVEYRATFVPLHPGSQANSEIGVDCVTYQALAAQARQTGLGLVSLQTFTDADGLTRYQATWKSR